MNDNARVLFACALSLCAFVARAQSAPQAVPAPQADAQATAAAEDTHCLRYTGSLIVASENQRNERNEREGSAATADAPRCSNNAGRSYTQDDIRSTGAVDLTDALRRLDPAIH